MHWWLLGLFVLATTAEIEIRSSGYETAEANQSKGGPVSAQGKDQQAYNSDGVEPSPSEDASSLHVANNVQANPSAPVTKATSQDEAAPPLGIEVHPPEPPPSSSEASPSPQPSPPVSSEAKPAGQYAATPVSAQMNAVESSENLAPPEGIQVHPPEPPLQIAQPPPPPPAPETPPAPAPCIPPISYPQSSPPIHTDPISSPIHADPQVYHAPPPPPPPAASHPPPSPAVHKPPPSSSYAKPHLSSPPAPHPPPYSRPIPRPQPPRPYHPISPKTSYSTPTSSGLGYKLTPVNSNYDKMAASHPAPHVSAGGNDQLGYSNESTSRRFLLIKKFSKFRRFSRA